VRQRVRNEACAYGGGFIMKLSRRSFLHTGLCGAGALWLASSRLSQAAVQFKMSACDWSLGVSCDPSGLDLALSLGLDGLEISAADGAADQLKIADPSYRQQYKEAMERTGLSVSSVAMGLLNDYPFATDDRAGAWLEQTIDGTADLGAKVILLAFFSKGDLLQSKGWLSKGGDLKAREVDAVVERVKAVVPRAEKAGVILGLENTLSAAQNLAILDRIQSDAVKVYYDVGNSTYSGYDIAREIRELDDRICQIHFKDGGFVLGEGKVDMKAVADAMTAIDYQGWIVLETAVQKKDRDASFRQNAAFVRGMF